MHTRLTRKKMWFIRIYCFLIFILVFLMGLAVGLLGNNIPKMIFLLTTSLLPLLLCVYAFSIHGIDYCFQRVLSQISEKSDLQKNSTTMLSEKTGLKLKIAQVIFIIIGPALIMLSAILLHLYNETLIMFLCMFGATAIFLICFSFLLAVKIDSCFAQLEELISGLEMKQIKKE
jgi:hypothetical protein